MKNSADLGRCYPPRPSAPVDNTLLDLQNSSYPTQPHSILLFPVDCDTHDFFAAVFDAASLFQINHVVHLNAPREDIFSVWRRDFFVLRDVHSQHVYLQEESLPWFLSAVELSEWPQFIS